MGLVGSAIAEILLLVIVLPHGIIFSFAYASNDDGIYAMVGMAITGFLFVHVLYPPHLAELGGGSALYAIYLSAFGIVYALEVAFQVQTCILGYEADACPLATGKAFGYFCHDKPFVLATPVITFYLQFVLLLYALVVAGLV